MPVLGLTGSIASGKSLVTGILREMNIRVIDADQVAREVVMPGLPAWEKIRQTFGPEVINDNLTLNREKLGEKVFGNKELLHRLNEITHPDIMEKIAGEINEFRESGADANNILVIDVPLLIETGSQNLVDQVWVVFVPEDLQLKRLMERDGISYAAALRRVRSQMSGEEKKRYADAVIDNSGSEEETREKVKQLVQQLINESGVGKIDQKQKQVQATGNLACPPGCSDVSFDK